MMNICVENVRSALCLTLQIPSDGQCHVHKSTVKEFESGRAPRYRLLVGPRFRNNVGFDFLQQDGRIDNALITSNLLISVASCLRIIFKNCTFWSCINFEGQLHRFCRLTLMVLEIQRRSLDFLSRPRKTAKSQLSVIGWFEYVNAKFN